MAGEARPHGAKPGGHDCLPLTFIRAHFPFSVTSILNSWLPHTTITRTLLTSQTAWPWCGTWSTRRLHRSTSSTVRYTKPLCFFLPHLPTPPHWWLLPWQAWRSANQPLYCTPLTLLLLFLLLCPHTPHPPAFMHIVSSPYWHPPPPHLSTNTCSWGAGEDMRCRSWIRAPQQD